MSELREKLLIACSEGNLLKSAVDLSRKDRSALIETVVALHNEKSVDLIHQFSTLQSIGDAEPSLYFTIRIFEEALPLLNAPTVQVMECIAHLSHYRTAGNLLSSPFIDFCAADPARPEEALAAINRSPKQLKDFIVAVLIAGTKIDLENYFEKILSLALHEDIEVRKRSIFSMGRIDYGVRHDLRKKALDCLERIVSAEANDHVLSDALRSICSICTSNESLLLQGLNMVDAILSKGGDNCLRTASELFGFHLEELSGPITKVISQRFQRVNPKDKDILRNIGFGIEKLLQQDDPNYGIAILENLLLANPESLSLKNLDNVIYGIHKSSKLTNRLLTRWFLKGDRSLCEGIYAIVNAAHDEELHLEIDVEELPSSDLIYLLFVARKTVGYLFIKPITATSIIISLMRQARDVSSVQALGSLLFNPFLLNYPGSLRHFLSNRVETESGQTQKEIKTALAIFNSYLDDLKSVGEISEMQPSQDQREAQSRHFNQKMSIAYKEAEKKSVLNQLFAKSVMLYGRKSIFYIETPGGQSNRMEMPLKAHESRFEFPIQECIDPFGLDMMLRVCRVEELVQK